MGYHTYDIENCQDTAHKLANAVITEAGWTLIAGIINTDVDHYFDFTNFQVTLSTSATGLGSSNARASSTILFSEVWPIEDLYDGFFCSSSGDQFAGLKFKAATSITSYTLTAPPDSSTAAVEWELQYSDDGVIYTAADARAGITWAADQSQTFTTAAPSAHVYWRLLFVGTSQTVQGFYRAQFMAGAALVSQTSPEYTFKCQGFGNFDDTYVNFGTYINILLNQYHMIMTSFSVYNAGDRGVSQSNRQRFVFSGINTLMEAHVVINERRILGGVHMGGLDFTFHMGAFLPFANPTEYPYPLLFTGNSLTYYSSDYTTLRTLIDRNLGCQFKDYMGVWRELGDASTSTSGGRDDANNYVVNPTHQNSAAAEHVSLTITYKRLTADTFVLFPLQIMANDTSTSNTDRYMVGEIEGAFWIPHEGVSSGFEFTDKDGDTHHVFQNGGRAGRSDFMTIKLA